MPAASASTFFDSGWLRAESVPLRVGKVLVVVGEGGSIRAMDTV